MPQSSKDSKGGKTHAKKPGSPASSASEATIKKSAGKSANSPVGPTRHGEKKSTP